MLKKGVEIIYECSYTKYRLVSTCRPYHVVLSYEIYNEEDSPQWWAGTAQQYAETLREGALAARAADPRAQILLGGMTYPSIMSGQPWDPGSVETFPGPDYQSDFVPFVEKQEGDKPIWMNEMGFATTPGETESLRADWFARAFSTYLAFPEVQELGVFRIRDLKPGNANIGGSPNYHLGPVYYNGRKKLAFSTVKHLMSLLNVGTITAADADARVFVTSGQAGEPYYHLFKGPDGKQILFANNQSTLTLDITLKTPGHVAYTYGLNGQSLRYKSFDGRTLRGVHLSPGNVAIFEIDP